MQVQVPEKSEDVGLFILSVTPPSACNLLKSCSAVCLHAGIFAASLGWTVFAANSYGVVALLALLHPSTRLPPVAVYSVCPSCVLTITVDPSLASSLLVLAPLSAAVYGSVGGVIGLFIRLGHK